MTKWNFSWTNMFFPWRKNVRLKLHQKMIPVSIPWRQPLPRARRISRLNQFIGERRWRIPGDWWRLSKSAESLNLRFSSGPSQLPADIQTKNWRSLGPRLYHLITNRNYCWRWTAASQIKYSKYLFWSSGSALVWNLHYFETRYHDNNEVKYNKTTGFWFLIIILCSFNTRMTVG